MRLLILLSALLTALAGVGAGSSARAAPAHQTLSLIERVAARAASIETGRRPSPGWPSHAVPAHAIGQALPAAITAQKPLNTDRLRV
jgi:hypothetical protein